MSDYSSKLRHPYWQQKRLLIFLRDKFTCQSCGSKTKELHIHHKRYYKDPWAVPDTYLITYCKDCHWLIERIKAEYPFRLLTIKKIDVFIGPKELYVTRDRERIMSWTLSKNGKLNHITSLLPESSSDFISIING